MEIREFYAKAKYIIVNDFILAIRTKNPHAIQPIALFGSMVLSMGLTFLSSIIAARLLGPSNYGDYKYIQTVWSLLTLVITFGYFYSGSRVLVLERDIQKCREISGTIILVSLIMGLIICLVIVLIAYPLDNIFHANVAKTMAQLAPLILVIPLSQSLPLILQSTNQIYLLAIFIGTPSILFLVSILVLSEINQITTSSVLFSQQLSSLIAIIFVLSYIKPSVKSVKLWWGEINKQHKTYGFPVYRGALAGIGTTYITYLSISYWVDNTAMGYFSLASSLVVPLQLLPNAIATSSFRSFASKPRISNKILLATLLISIASLAVSIIFFGAPLSWIYTTKFNEVGPMARVLGLAAIFIGFGDLFNRFLGAHGEGKSIQNAAYANGAASVVCTLIFVPLFGAWGAVLTMIIANGIYFLLLFLSYRTYSHKIIT
jgi:O-antigen/teichoic acid export membrane protein